MEVNQTYTVERNDTYWIILGAETTFFSSDILHIEYSLEYEVVHENYGPVMFGFSLFYLAMIIIIKNQRVFDRLAAYKPSRLARKTVLVAAYLSIFLLLVDEAHLLLYRDLGLGAGNLPGYILVLEEIIRVWWIGATLVLMGMVLLAVFITEFLEETRILNIPGLRFQIYIYLAGLMGLLEVLWFMQWSQFAPIRQGLLSCAFRCSLVACTTSTSM